ncbi:hypothetical protein BLNAU_9381 [Blattamonas nauphoetae]|uniref:Right handed beta helix domain-containing protein n=1 Tax=Blattamonas nauphoetae TaxID=2049346 RepID=A0ABQ9XW32_9EUKA|nr:hypothetical protein BLNAU_9381 [Blattamonas nauphoetae]
MILHSTPDSFATIRIESSTHRNLESHILAPLCDVLPNTPVPLETVQNDEPSGSLSIIGAGLSFADNSLSTSTGPLFTFRQAASASQTLPAHTTLLHSALSNVTSSGITHTRRLSPLSRQTLSACDIARVTNHFDGTALLDINTGATVLCMNSSVSHSVSDRHANADVTHPIQDKHFTTRSTSAIVPYGTTHLSILRCTFIVSVANFGGAFYVTTYNVDEVIVASCNFHQCQATDPDGIYAHDGGALLFSGSTNADYTTRQRMIYQVDQCVFTECFAADAGGALSVGIAQGSVSECFFERCVAKRAPAIFTEDAKLTGSNNYIIGCASEGEGTLIFSGWRESILDISPDISKFYFRDNVINGPETRGRDVFVGNMHNFPLTPEKIADCDTSSDYLAVHIKYPDSDSASIPQVAKGTHIVSSSMAMESSTATFTVTCAHAMTGTMAVLLDGDTLPRLIFVTFANSATGTGTATVGAGGVLPSGKTYTLRSAVMPGWGLQMYVVSAVARVKDANTTTIEVTGFGLKEGSFWMLAANKEEEVNVTMTLTPSSSTTLTGDATLYPFAESGPLKYDTEYTIKDVFFVNGVDEMNLVVYRPVTFKTPIEPARIETVSAALNGKKDTAVLSMEGRKLHDKQQKVVISRVGSSTTWSGEIFNVSESGCLANFTVGDEETASTLKFGETYEIDSVGEGVDSFYVNPGRSFFVPLPPRIATLTFGSGEITTNWTILTVEGTSLPNGKTYTATTTSSHSFPIEFSSESEGTSTILLGWADEMKYGTQYTISSVVLSEAGKDDEFILLDSSEFTTPLGPSVSAIGCDFDSSTLNNVILTVTSSGMSGETFTVQVSEKQDASNILSFLMTFSSTSGSKNVAVYKQTGTLEYGKEYELVKVFSSSVNAVIPSPALVLKVPAAPSRIIEAKCDLGGTNETDALITLEGLFLPGGKSFTITLFKLVSDVRTGDAFTLTGAISGTGNQTSTQLTETLYPSHANLSFGTDYEITALTIAETKTIVEETAKFSIPAEPSRIVGLKNTPNVDGNRTEIVLVGRWMEAGDYTVTLSPSASFTIRFEGTKTEERESKPTTLWLYGSKVDLSFDVSYTLVSVVKATADTPEIFIDQPIAPFMIAGKTRLTEMRLESYSLDKKKADFVMTGLLLSPSKIYEVELESASSSRWIAMKLDGSEWKGEAVLYPSVDATLKYGDSYSINGFREQGTTVELLHDTLEVIEIIPEPPRLISCLAEPATGLNTTTLTLTTHALTSGAIYTLTLRGSKLGESDKTSNSADSDVILYVFGQETLILPLTLYPLSEREVEYGMIYSIISLSTEGETQPVLIEPVAFSFTTPSTPFRVEHADSALAASRNEVKIVLTGTAFPTPSEPSQEIEVTLTGGSLGSPLTVSGEFDEDGWIWLKCWTETGHSHKLDFGESYSVSAVSVASLSALVNNPVSFIVPHPPKVKAATLHPNAHNTAVTIELSGTGLAMMREYKVTLRPSFSFVVLFADASRAMSPTLRLDTRDGLAHNTEYSVERIVGESDSDDVILIDGSVSFKTPVALLFEVIVSSSGVGGGEDGEDCGSFSFPCETVLIGWEMGRKKGEMEKMILKVRDSVSSGGVIVVGRGSMEIGGLFGEKGRMTISDRTSTTGAKSESEIVVDGGEIVLLDLIISVGCLNSVWGWGAGMVVGGKGTVIVKSVSIVCEGGEKGGMGLVGLEQGRLEVDDVSVENVDFREGVGLFRCLGGQNEITANFKNVVIRNTTFSEGGILTFSSTTQNSVISISDSSIDGVRMKVRDGSDSALISIRTRQTRLTTSKCLFFESGCEQSNGMKIGRVLSITLDSSDKHETVQRVGLDYCLFVDCAGGEGSVEGGVVIRSGDGLSRLSVCGSWFEERSGLLLPSSFERDWDGRVVVRKRRMSYSVWKLAGVVVERGRMLPVIDRKGSGFSNCGLIVRSIALNVEQTRNNGAWQDEL